jgi:hypothetical protein
MPVGNGFADEAVGSERRALVSRPDTATHSAPACLEAITGRSNASTLKTDTTKVEMHCQSDGARAELERPLLAAERGRAVLRVHGHLRRRTRTP